jgi:hypothetical protein
MKTSYKHLVAFANAARQYLSYTKEVYQVELELCSTDDHGEIIRDSQGRPAFTKTNQKKRDDAVTALTERKTKFTYALNRVLNQLGEKTDAIMQERLEALRVEHAAVDEKGILLAKDANGNYPCEKAELIKLMKATSALLDAEDIDVNPYFASSVPADLSDAQLDAFAGIAIRQEQVDYILKAREDALDDEDNFQATHASHHQEGSVVQ